MFVYSKTYTYGNVPIDARNVVDALEGVLTQEEFLGRVDKRLDELMQQKS
jgi:hypothetical protein